MDTITRQRRSLNMSRIRSSNTSPEMIVRRLVYKMGFRYRLHAKHLPGKPDLVFTRLRKIIDVRGCFWHQHKRCIDSHIPKSNSDYWRPKLARNVQRDRKNERQLKANGWRMLTLWECELFEVEEVQQRVSAFLRGE